MDVIRMAAFADGSGGGNPAGVVLCDALPSSDTMQEVAAAVGYSETAFAAPSEGAWRVRYFAPAAEIPFCGHATIALGAALAAARGEGSFPLNLNSGRISVEGRRDGGGFAAAFWSPPTRSEPASKAIQAEALGLFAYTEEDLNPTLPIAFIEAGARHLLVALNARSTLASMAYDFNAGARFMRKRSLATISLVFAETATRFHARNAFAAGGVYEDPATGAAAAALAGYLRSLEWPHGGRAVMVQGEDMGVPCRIIADIPDRLGSGIRISGAVRMI